MSGFDINSFLATVWLISSWYFIFYKTFRGFKDIQWLNPTIWFDKQIKGNTYKYNFEKDSIMKALEFKAFTYWSWLFNTIIITLGYKKFIDTSKIIFGENIIPSFLFRVYVGTAWFGYIWQQFSLYPPYDDEAGEEPSTCEYFNGFRKVVASFMQSYIMLAMILWITYSYNSISDVVKNVLLSNRNQFIWQGLLIPVIYCVQDIIKTKDDKTGGFQPDGCSKFSKSAKSLNYLLSLSLTALSLTCTHIIFDKIISSDGVNPKIGDQVEFGLFKNLGDETTRRIPGRV